MPHLSPTGDKLCTGRARWSWGAKSRVCQKCGARDPEQVEVHQSLHLETSPGRAACGRVLPTAGFFTDDVGMFEEREGSRCKSCWRAYAAKHPGVSR